MKINVMIVTLIFIFAGLGLLGCNDSLTDHLYIDYLPDYSGSDENTISLVSTNIDGENITLAVDAYHISNGAVHSVYFDLVFRDDIIDYYGYESGAFWNSDQEVVYQIGIDPHDSGRLIVGISILGSDAIENGTGDFVLLKFRAVSAGVCPLWFEENGLKDNTGPDGAYITGVSWYGGHVTVSK